jgi:hypothetical protein
VTVTGGPTRRFWRSLLLERTTYTWGNFSWLSVSNLIASANDVPAKADREIVNDWRMRWVAEQRARGVHIDKPIRLEDASNVLALGDPGEMDASQYVMVRALAEVEPTPDVLLLMSDVIYPAGDVNAWRDGVYLPYFGLPKEAWDRACATAQVDVELPDWQVIATPGNHDWYDGLCGFMYHACGAEPLPPVEFSGKGLGAVRRLLRRLWQAPAQPDRRTLEPLRAAARDRANSAVPAGASGPMPRQPGPYFAVDLGPRSQLQHAALRLLCVDTGVDGSIDVEQARWVKRMCQRPKAPPTIVVTGKPVAVNNTIGDLPVDGRVDPQDDPTGGAPKVLADTRLANLNVFALAKRACQRRKAIYANSLPSEALCDLIEGGNVIATLAGDTHNAQRLVFCAWDETQPCGGGSQIELRLPRKPSPGKGLPPVQIIAGGGGAYMSETHTVKLREDGARPVQGRRVPDGSRDLPPVDHMLYPSRAESVAMYARRVRRVGALILFAVSALAIGATVAAATFLHGLGSAAVEVPIAHDHIWHVDQGRTLCVIGAPLLALAIVAGVAYALSRWVKWLPHVALFVYLLAAVAGVGAAWDLPVEALPIVVVGFVYALFVALGAVSIPLVRAFPELDRLFHIRAVLALVGVLIAVRLVGDDLLSNVGLDALALAGVGLVAFVIAQVIPALNHTTDDWAAEDRLGVTRTVIVSVLALVAAVAPSMTAFLVPADWGEARETLWAIAVIELAVVMLLLLVDVAKATRSAQHVMPSLLRWGLPPVAALLVTLTVLAFLGTLHDRAHWIPGSDVQQGVVGLVATVALPFALMGLALLKERTPPADDAQYRDEIREALRARDGVAGAEPGRRTRLFRAMTIAAVPGVAEIAEAVKPPFRKSFLMITWAQHEGATTAVDFTLHSVDDEPGVPAQPGVPSYGVNVAGEFHIKLV